VLSGAHEDRRAPHPAVHQGDTVFNNVHLWTASTRAPGRKAWLSTLDKLDALKPEG
jgi:hypothetical protein